MEWIKMLGLDLTPDDDEEKGGAGTAEGEEEDTETDESAETLNTEESESDGASDKKSNAVPYSRFKEINDEKNRLATEKDETTRKLIESETRLQMLQAASQPSNDEDSPFKTTSEKALRDNYLKPFIRAEMKAERERLDRLEAKQEKLEQNEMINRETANLANAIRDVKKLYPALKETDIQALEDRYILDPKVSIKDYAKKLAENRKIVNSDYVNSKKANAERTARMPDGSSPSSENAGNKSHSWLSSLENAGKALEDARVNAKD